MSYVPGVEHDGWSSYEKMWSVNYRLISLLFSLDRFEILIFLEPTKELCWDSTGFLVNNVGIEI